jgi:excisionase family DNA binding protein
MPDELLSTTTAAARLGISARRVVALIDTGRLPAIRVGRSWVIRAADLAKVADRPNGWPKGRRFPPSPPAE